MIRDPRPDNRPPQDEPFPWHFVLWFGFALVLLVLLFNH